MRLVFGLVLVLGLALAGGAVYMARDYIGAYQQQLDAERAKGAQNVPTVEVYVVTQQLRYGEQMLAEHVRAVRWPRDAIPEGAFHALEALFPPGEEFRTVLRTMEKDEAILVGKVTKPGADAGVSSRLSPGMRAFAIKVDVASGVGGSLRPGNRVDVYWTGSLGGESRQDVTKLIEASLRLIAVDQSADEEISVDSIARTVTVEATPRQVAALAQAQSSGDLSLSLVGAEDDTVSGAVEIDQNQLLGIQEQVILEQQAARICTIKTRRGAEIVEVPIDCPEE